MHIFLSSPFVFTSMLEVGYMGGWQENKAPPKGIFFYKYSWHYFRFKYSRLLDTRWAIGHLELCHLKRAIKAHSFQSIWLARRLVAAPHGGHSIYATQHAGAISEAILSRCSYTQLSCVDWKRQRWNTFCFVFMRLQTCYFSCNSKLAIIVPLTMFTQSQNPSNPCWACLPAHNVTSGVPTISQVGGGPFSVCVCIYMYIYMHRCT